jgi:hypothetical protein
MSLRVHPWILVFVSLAGVVRMPAQTQDSQNPRVLYIELVESNGQGINGMNDFYQIATEFRDAIESRKWPIQVKLARFAANSVPHDLELRIRYKGIYPEAPGDETFHAWITLFDHGTTHEFGMVTYRYYMRPGQNMDDVSEHAMRGAAKEAAKTLGSLLFPKR